MSDKMQKIVEALEWSLAVLLERNILLHPNDIKVIESALTAARAIRDAEPAAWQARFKDGEWGPFPRSFVEGAMAGIHGEWEGRALYATPPPPATLCPCKDRPAQDCPGEWEQGCDLGANEEHARRVPEARQQQDELAAARAEVETLRAVFFDTAKALECAPDNEVVLSEIDKSRKDAERYRWLKSNNIVRVFPAASGMMSQGGTRILANTKDWLPGDFTYVVDGVTRDVDAAIDAAIAAQRGES
jgi:hypothetical protein